MAESVVTCRATSQYPRAAVVAFARPDLVGQPLQTSLQPLFDPAAALSAVQSGTHHFVAKFKKAKRRRHGQEPASARPTGGMWFHCVPTAADKLPSKDQALLTLSRNAGLKSNELSISFPPPSQVPLSSMPESVVDPLRMPELPIGVQQMALMALTSPKAPLQSRNGPVTATVTFGSTFKRLNILLTVGGHRILFLEPPSTRYSNRSMKWEARLLYPNYPLERSRPTAATGARLQQVAPIAPGTTSSGGDPIEGVHYTLLASHSDTSSCCRCCSCLGGTGANGGCNVKLSLIQSLAHTQVPHATGDADMASDKFTSDQLVLAVLAMIPIANSAIATRKFLTMVAMPVFSLFLIVDVVIVLVFVTRTSRATPSGSSSTGGSFGGWGGGGGGFIMTTATWPSWATPTLMPPPPAGFPMNP